MKKIKVGILGATGMVGQRFVSILANHPWFEISVLAASPRSKGLTYVDAVSTRWSLPSAIPRSVKHTTVLAVEADIDTIVQKAEMVFCALDMDENKIKKLELQYAKKGIPIVSNNSAHRWTPDVPMIIPEVNFNHLNLISIQKKLRGFTNGFIVVKPNCSIQSYVIILEALKLFEPTVISVTSLQAISGAGKTFKTWPEMIDNVIPFIGGEEKKSGKEPLKIWGTLTKKGIRQAKKPLISATCIRVAASDGHMASVSVRFKKKITKQMILSAIKNFGNPLEKYRLPSSPKSDLIHYFEDDDRPQTHSDRNYENGMGITMGRLRPDDILDWKFIALSHNTIRGAAGGAILTAELLVKKGYISGKKNI